MTYTDTAAAYGLFQIAFAHALECLAVATFRLRRRREPQLEWEPVFRQQVRRLLDEFRKELRQVENSHAHPEVHDLLDACDTMSKLAAWRNDRIHARVRMTPEGYALYDWRTGQRLSMSLNEMVQNMTLATGAINALEVHADSLIKKLQDSSAVDRDLEDIFKTSEELAEEESD